MNLGLVDMLRHEIVLHDHSNVWSTGGVKDVGVERLGHWRTKMDVNFVLNGRAMRLTREVVEACAHDAEPEPVRSHAVKIQGKLFPPKQIFALATGLDRLDFTTVQARTQLIRLGFDVVRVGESK